MAHFISQNEIAVSSPFHDSRMLLVLNIVEDHFGSQTREIAAYLLSHQDVTLPRLESTFCSMQRKCQFRLSKESLCSSLLVLQQHECLICELPPQSMNALASLSSGVMSEKRMTSSSSIRERIIYSIDSRMVLNRLLIGRIIHHANCATQLEGVGELIVEELFMNGKQLFQQLRADVDARLTAEAHKKTDPSEREFQFKKIQLAFDVLASRGLIVMAQPLKLNRKCFRLLPPKSRGAKNKMHLLGTFGEVARGSGVGTKRGRGYEDDNDLDSDDEDDDQDLPAEMRRPRARSLSSTGGSRYVGDGEWKEDCGFGPITDELIYDADAELRAKNANSYDADGLFASGIEEAVETVGDSRIKVKIEDLTGDDDAPHKSFAKSDPPISSSSSSGGISVKKLVIQSDDEDDDNIDHTTSSNHFTCDRADLDQKTDSIGGASTRKTADSKNCLWMIGWNQLINEERHLACIQYTTERMQVKAGRVVKIILDATTKAHTYQIPIGSSEVSSPLKMLTIFDEYRRCWSVDKATQPEDTLSVGSSSSNSALSSLSSTNAKLALNLSEKVLDLPTLKTLLKVLVDDRCLTETSITSSSSSGNKDMKEYQVNVGEIINKIKRKTFQSIASARFGISTARIIELLTSHDELIEQQQLSDLAIMPAREARENLYKLYKDQWVEYRDISKRLDYNPASTYYFWHLDQSKLKATVLDHSHKAILNMRIRRGMICSELSTAIVNSPLAENVRSSLDRIDRTVMNVNKTIMMLEL